ncbi:MAG TPA: NTP transferase domain-containing protein, partial [Solirubrobacteraceae bacterium]|nr:NTP transferase domain-containing protein [Solirubrobacteraceae bacterium]
MAETEHGEGAAASTPVGVVLAGGAGRRLGGLGKASIELAGRPLLDYPISALREVCAEVAVVAKRDSRLPALPASVARWNEPDEPRHPLTGILHALERSAGRGVLVCAVDMPLVDAATLRALLALANARAGALAVVAGSPDGL